MDLRSAKEFIVSEVVAPWRKQPMSPGRTFAQIVRERAAAHFGPRLRRIGFEPTASDLEGLTGQILAEIDPPPAKAPPPAQVATKLETLRTAAPAAKPDREAEGKRLHAMLCAWKDKPELQKRFSTFGDFLVDQGWRAESGFANGRQSQPAEVSNIDPRLPLADRVKAQWKTDPETRREFLGDDGFERYHAFRRAEERGSVGPLGRRGAVVAFTPEEIAAARSLPKK